MAGVVKATVGQGYLGPGQTSWWQWYVYSADAWYFWPSSFAAGWLHLQPVPHAEVEVVRVVSRKEAGDPAGKHPALIQIHNPSPTLAYFVLRVVRVY
jgi:hypothetical protein